MILAAAYRRPCGGITALVSDIDVATACGITCDRIWWCECGTHVDGARPADVCAHLNVLASAPAEVIRP